MAPFVAKLLKKQITIRLDPESIRYFKNLAEETGISYQNLIDLYLKDCAREQRRLSIKWSKMVSTRTGYMVFPYGPSTPD